MSAVPERRTPGRVLSCLSDYRLNITLELCADAVYVSAQAWNPKLRRTNCSKL